MKLSPGVRGLILAGLLAGTRVVADPSAPVSSLPPDTVLRPSAGAPGAPLRTEGGMGGTAAVILVMTIGAAAGWVFWRKLRAAGPATRGEHQLAIAETRSLGNRQYLVVAAYGERRYLLGVCPGRIDLLSTLADDATHSAESPK